MEELYGGTQKQKEACKTNKEEQLIKDLLQK